jgi:hypothetical protein
LLGGPEIEIRESDPAGMTGAKMVERPPDDGVVIDLELMTVFED